MGAVGDRTAATSEKARRARAAKAPAKDVVPASPIHVHSQDIIAPIPDDWRGEHGARLSDQAVRARLVGPSGAPVVAALGGISADRFVAAEAGQTTSSGKRVGWWSEVVKPGGGVDLNRFRVLGVDFAPLAPSEPVAITPAD